MKIIDLQDREHEKPYFMCLEDLTHEMDDAGDHKEHWYRRMLKRGLRVKLALDKEDNVCGMIQYAPIEYSLVEGSDLYFIYCIWVHGYKAGRGNHQNQGMGTALLKAAEEDVKALGAKGIVAWGIMMPWWMKASWYIKHGYTKVDRNGIAILLWKPFSEDAVPPRWIKNRIVPEKIEGKVVVTAFKNGWCPSANMNYERARRAVEEFGDEVIFKEIDTFEKDTIRKWGMSDELFIDDKQISDGPPLAYEKIKKLIEKKVRKLK